jgi:phage-related protein
MLGSWHALRRSTTATRAAASRSTISSRPCHSSAPRRSTTSSRKYLNGQPPEAPPAPFPITSQIDGELRELRVRFGNTRYRILYQRSENLVVLLHALEKDTEAVSQADIELAKQRMADFKRRMDALRRRPPRAAGKDAPPPSRPV